MTANSGAAEVDVALVFDESGNLVSRTLYGPNVDQPLASEDGSGNVRWFLADEQGTIRDVAAYDSGAGTTSVVDHIKYDAFGNITSQSDSNEEPRQTFTGREWDADAGLFYFRARWYDAAVGRFISEDPMGFAGGDANVSRYVGNDPVNFTDPSGLAAEGNDAPAPDPNLMLQPEIQALMKEMGSYGAGPNLDVTHVTGSFDWRAPGEGPGIPRAILTGMGHGGEMVLNHLTLNSYFGYLDDWGMPLNADVQHLIKVNGGLYGTADGFARVGAHALHVAGGVYLWQAAGLPTFGAGLINTSETTVAFQLSGQTFVGTAAGVTQVTSLSYLHLSYWTSITGIPLLSTESAMLGAGSSLWISSYPCASRALQAFINGYVPFPPLIF